MNPVQVDFPAEWDESIKVRIAERGKSTVAEYVRDLVEADIASRCLDEETERLIIEGLDSPPGPVIDDAYLNGLKQRVKEAAKGITA